MIVKDEAHVVADTLACVAPHIDTWVIVDTGSTDNTIDIISSFFAAHHIPGEIYQRPWVNFGVNRTEALQLCAYRAEYIWVIDADDLVVGNIDLTNLTLDSYLLRFGSDFRYWRKQIFRSTLRWKYEGVLHEYPACLDADSTEGRLDGDYYIESRRLGSRSRTHNKYERDAQILLQAVTDNPNDSRSTFYLAQSYFDADRPEKALEYYTKRAGMGGWDEEVFYSKLRCAECLELTDQPWEAALEGYLQAWQSRSQRVEPLYHIAKHYRSRAQYDLGYLFARRAKEIPLAEGDNLFVSADVSDWKNDDELAICAFYTGQHRESFDICTRLINLPGVPEADRERILSNRDFAAEQLKDEDISYPETIVERLTAGARNRSVASTITLTITSCRRYELFEKTVNSFLNCCLDVDLIDRWICIDDASSEADRRMMSERYPLIEFIFNDPSDKGHARSMNMLLDTIESELWIHLEDDWQFFVRDEYVRNALAILDDDLQIAQVLFNRNYGETFGCREISGGLTRRTKHDSIRYRLHEHFPADSVDYGEYIRNLPAGARSNTWWPHYSLRPSLIRMSAIREVGSYDPESGHFELDFARRYFEKGYRSAFFDAINCLHIGRLTWEKRSDGIPNAYDLNDERQFGRTGRRKPHRVKLLANWTTSEQLCEGWNRQSRGDGGWDDIEITNDDSDIDYWAIINHPRDAKEHFDKGRTVVFQMEPRQAVSSWGDWASPDPRAFLQVRSHDRYRNNSEWHLDLRYADLLTRRIEKTKDLSCVTSGKMSDPGHRLRIGFLKYLEASGTSLDIFGSDNIRGFRNYRGVLPPHNKNEGVLPYRYTIAVESNAEINYFTEKIIDGILGECLCFYWGCPNLEEYIEPAAFIRLPLDDFEQSREIIERAIRDDERERRLGAIRSAKRRILDEYQFFPTIARIVHGHQLAERLEVKVINLDRRRDRWDSFCTDARDALSSKFFERFERVPAVDGLSLSMDASIHRTFRGNDFNYRRGMVGCALSHVAVWKQLAERDDAIYLVLEDDARLSSGFEGQLVEVCGSLAEEHRDFDVAFLGFFVWPQHEASESDKRNLSARLYPMEWGKYVGGTSAYLISSIGARRLLALVEKEGIQEGIDWFIMRKARNLNVLECVPKIATAPLAVAGSRVDTDIQNDFVAVSSYSARQKAAHVHDGRLNFQNDRKANPSNRVEDINPDLREFLSAQLKGKERSWPDGIAQADTERFIGYTDACGIQPLLYYLMRSSNNEVADSQHAPDAFQQRLMMETINARMRTDETREVLDALETAGVRVLVLKGLALGHLVYPHPGIRPVCDVDLLIDHSQAALSQSTLESLGYTCAVKYFHQVTYKSVDSRGFVHNLDLHSAISESATINREFSFDQLLERSIPLTALGAQARTLCYVDALLLACAHIAQHRAWARLIWLYDIHLLAGRLSAEEAAEFVAMARRKRLRAVCSQGLKLAKMTFETQFEGEKLRRLSRRSGGLSQLTEPSAHYLAKRNLLFHDFMLVMRSGCWKDRRRLLHRVLLKPSEVKRLESEPLAGFLMPFLKAHSQITGSIGRWMRS